ncbi:MAG: transposase [Proteobacteria bacterium]|nr:transposase [Pseudomonadota bacterium]
MAAIQQLERSFPVSDALAAEPAAVAQAEIRALGADRVSTWRRRPLQTHYVMAAFDRIVFRTRDDLGTRQAELKFCLTVARDGSKEIAGIWTSEDWHGPVLELRRRGMAGAALLHGDGTGGMAGALDRMADGDRIDHVGRLIRLSEEMAPKRVRRSVASALRQILQAPRHREALSRLEGFAASRAGSEVPEILALWRDRLPRLDGFLAQSAALKSYLAGFDATESLKEKLSRRGQRIPACFADEADALQTMTVVAMGASQGWKVAPKIWASVRCQLRTDPALRPAIRRAM